MKEYYVSAFFPEVRPAHEAEQSTTVRATKASVAAYRGLAVLEQRTGIKGKRISTVRLVVRIVRVVPAGEPAAVISTKR
jgi:hypothetical protein